MTKHKTSTVWLVGASSGIGRELALQLAEAGCRVVLSARNVDSLQELRQLYPERFEVLPLDVTDPDSVEAASQWLESTLDSPLDTLALVAGNCEYVDVNHLDVDLFRRMLEVNFLGHVNVTRVALPLLRRSPSPYLVYVSSSAIFAGLPRASAYGASKAALSYFAASLRADLVHEGFDISVVSPGFVETPLTDRNDFDMPFLISAEEAAYRIFEGMKRRQQDIRFPRRFVWLLKVIAALPASWRLKLLGRLSRHQPSPAGERA